MFAAEPQREVREVREASPRVQLGLPTLIMTVVMAPFGCPSPFLLLLLLLLSGNFCWSVQGVSRGVPGCSGLVSPTFCVFLNVFMNLHEVVLVAAACGCHLLVKLAAQPETLCIFLTKMLPEILRKREKGLLD